MLKTENLETKVIYVIGDSHALAFQNKLLTLPDHKINFLPVSICSFLRDEIS